MPAGTLALHHVYSITVASVVILTKMPYLEIQEANCTEHSLIVESSYNFRELVIQKNILQKFATFNRIVNIAISMFFWLILGKVICL